MRLKNKAAFILILLGFTSAALSMPVSGALSSGQLQRAAIATISDDSHAFLQLTGFDSQYYNLNNKYSRFGSITNNTNRVLTLTITITVDFGSLNNKNCVFGTKIGNTLKEITNNGNSTMVMVITLNPWQTVDVMASLDRNQNHTVKASYDFAVKDTTGGFTMELGNSIDAPRQIYCY